MGVQGPQIILKNNLIGVVYLAYVPFGIPYLIKFISSYKKHKSGIDHDLIILFNGFTNDHQFTIFINYLEQHAISYQYLACPEKYDIGSYFYSAKCLDQEYLFFLNTYSEILCDDWLLKLYRHIIKPNIGAVGCTGSWGSYGPGPSVLKLNFIGAFSYWLIFKFNFNRFLDIHLRTNAFLINRKLFLSINYTELKPKWLNKIKYDNAESKLKTLHFEHGKESLTRQLLNRNLNVLIVDKFGNSYTKEIWNKSQTFWIGDQENLIISDNQTKIYELGSPDVRANLIKRAWSELRVKTRK